MKNTLFPRMHVSYYVSNINNTVEFYKQFFNAEPTKVKSDYAKFELAEPSLIISFVQSPEKVRHDFGHLGFQVASAEILNATLERINTLNVDYLEEREVSCCYAKQDKFWVADPDGIRWEIYHFHEDVEFNDPHYASACCPPEQNVKEEVCCEPGSGCC